MCEGVRVVFLSDAPACQAPVRNEWVDSHNDHRPSSVFSSKVWPQYDLAPLLVTPRYS